jgi:hypothetical protein
MSNIDRQRVTAVRTLQMMGYVFRDGGWVLPPTVGASTAEADRLHALLIHRADQLDGCIEGRRKPKNLERLPKLSKPTKRCAGRRG